MPKSLELTNQIFGRLTALYKDGIKKSKITWHCLCSCGNTSSVRGSDLVTGKTQSCGCLALETRSLPFGDAAINKAINSYKQAARKRGYTWELSREEFIKVTSKDCYYCGAKPSNCRDEKSQCNNGSYTYNGIDRVNNNEGYSMSNVVPCCGMCNTAKRHYSQEEFYSWVERVYIKTEMKKRKVYSGNYSY